LTTLTNKRRPRATAVANRRAILHAAIQVFSTYGYEGTTTRAIAKKARLEHGHLAKYFNTKEALWRAAIEEFNGELLLILDDGLRRADLNHPIAAARAVLPDVLEFFAVNHRLSRLMLQEFSISSPRHDWLVSEIGRPIWERLQPLLKALRARDRFLAGNPTFSYFALIGSALLFFGSSSEVRTIAGYNPTDQPISEDFIEYLLYTILHLRPKAPRSKSDPVRPKAPPSPSRTR
jgi:TetR/AcrR family transcriptional regulator